MEMFFNKIKAYFTENIYRKTFFIALFTTVALLIVNIIANETIIFVFAQISVLISAFATLIDSMIDRVVFCRKIYFMQVEHFRQMPEDEVKPAFSEKEKLYIKNRKRTFVWTILAKTVIIVMLFILIFGN
jgi:hypothetical protein